jgi:HPt (histidine-containing phosphotransfer) domain-containing protein
MTTTALAACPFCGSAGRLQENGLPSYLYWEVVCTDDERCGVVGPDHTLKEAAIAAWNRRATPPALISEDVAALVEQLKGRARWCRDVHQEVKSPQLMERAAATITRLAKELAEADQIATMLISHCAANDGEPDLLISEWQRLSAQAEAGWRTVPVEPTREMLEAAADAPDDDDWLSAMAKAYRAMLAAAPDGEQP